jgi:hypothetical protein
VVEVVGVDQVQGVGFVAVLASCPAGFEVPLSGGATVIERSTSAV